MIRLKCPHCTKPMQVSDSLAGGWDKCPDCGRDVPIDVMPAVSQHSQGPDLSQFRKDPPAGAERIQIICPNHQCGYKGPAWLKSDCNTMLGCLLTFFFFLPGILYFVIRGGEKNKHCECPQCGMRVR
jgi:endogenous inhibitor of DNA gyrase (YacG/DUF329 family)